MNQSDGIGADDPDEDYQAARWGVLRLAGFLPPTARSETRRRLLLAMEQEFTASGISVPPWMERLTADIG